VGTVRDVGVVGEVAAGWKAGEPPAVVAAFDETGPAWSGPSREPNAGSEWGPLEASQTRPLEVLHVGGLRIPLALNGYTGGIADWPARIVHALTGTRGAVTALNGVLGAGVILLVWRFLRRNASGRAAVLASLFLATDWSFVYFRKVLGGTEILLQVATVLLLGSLWEPRKKGTDLHAGAAVGLGLLAKWTFVSTTLALVITTAVKARSRLRAFGWRSAIVAGLLLLPLVICAVHHVFGLPGAPRIVSHDDLLLQVRRVFQGWSGPSAGRESAANLFYYFGEPLRWFGVAYGGPVVSWVGAGVRALTWAAVGVGLWRRRDDALLRFVAGAALLQVILLQVANRDLHHLGQAAPLLAIVVGLALERGWRWILVGGAALAGIRSLVLTDVVLANLRAPVFTEHGQRELTDLLRSGAVTELWTSDYDLYGVFEVRAPEIQCSHAWGAVSTRRDTDRLTADVLRSAVGAHWLIVRPSSPMIYNLHPKVSQVRSIARSLGLEVEEEGVLSDANGEWAWLLEVRPEPARSDTPSP